MIATVFCQVSWNDSAPVGPVSVEVHHVLYGRPNAVERRLARGLTDDSGAISLVFPAVFKGFVRVRVFGVDGTPLGGEVLTAPLSGLHRVSVVMTRPGSVRSEVERLMRVIRPWTDGQLRRLLTWDAQRLEHITQQTGRSLALLELLHQSAELSDQLGVPVELLYGLGRAGLPLTVDGLARTSRRGRRRALTRAVSARWVPTFSDNDRQRYLERLTRRLGHGARLRAHLHSRWSRWSRQELMTTVEFTSTVMTLA